MTAALKTVIVDDEPLAVERMSILCRDIDGVDVVGTAEDGVSAIRMIKDAEADLVFLDIGMPDQDGISVAKSLATLPHPPAIIFVTAFDSFAVDAFNLAAVDYVLKPASAERLALAVRRATERRAKAEPESARPSDYADEFWIPHRSELIRVAAIDIERVDAERDYMRLTVGERSYLMHQTITALEARLNPRDFIRLHRSVIVRRDLIERLGHDRTGAWHAELTTGDTVRIGRTYLSNAKSMAGR
jgi:DNA-binding LytR/AlgR family response regulator